ncbi:MAG: homoserine dehydrogenase [Candidatus Omnitrophota bacterium]
MKGINVGIIGLGTVGGGVVRALIEKRQLLRHRCGVGVNLTAVFDSDKKAYKRLRVARGIIAGSADEILDNARIDVVVELIGGIRPARDIILRALDAGKYVVTANKALLAEYGERIFRAARDHDRYIGFEASVCGAMPVIKLLRESFSANRLQALYGIVNGTSNFILTDMSEKQHGMGEALGRAKEEGIAEADPGLDIDGLDACHKLCILAMLAFGVFIRPSDVYVEGIKDVDQADILYARSWGYEIKPLAIAKRTGNRLELRVHPTLIPHRHLLSAVKGADNAVFIKGDMIGDAMIYGKGAGRLPAASSVLSDIMDIARYAGSGTPVGDRHLLPDNIHAGKISRIGDLVTRYYLRFSAIDKPGVLAGISSILAKNKISIATVTQKGRKERQIVPVVMLTHEAKESSMNRALGEINRLNFIKRKTVKLRIER